MKNSILKKLSKKYNKGGLTDLATMVGEKGVGEGIKQGLTRVASSLTGPGSGFLAGLGRSVAPVAITSSLYGMYKEGQEYSGGRAGYTQNPNYVEGSDKFGGGDSTAQFIPSGGLVKEHTPSVWANKTSMFQTGGIPLPGGIMSPIPGSDAVEFMGNQHDESGMGSDSGIMVDANTEVEDGETMDQVNMAKTGGKRDYFFSSHLKKDGVSYADMHKNILQNGGGQEEVNMLAKMQEKAAGRDPNQVAKLGGVMKYEEGGRMDLEEIMRQYPNYGREILNLQKNTEAYKDERRRRMNERRPSEEEGERRMLQNLQLFVDQGRELTGEQQIQYDQLSAMYNTDWMDQDVEADDPDGFDTKAIVEQTNPEAFAKLYPEEAEQKATELAEQQKLLDKLRNQVMNPGMPLESKIGLGAQFIPTIGAMLTKQKDPEEFTYTPGFTSPIVAGRVKGLKYEAPTQNEARARLASAYTGEQRFLDTSGGGAATMSNRQALFARKIAAEGTLGAQESKDAITAENLTKKSEEQANLRNVQNELTAATTNAQLIQKEADRRAAVDNANIQLRNMKENEKISNRMNILNTLAQGVGTVMGDTMQYKADERLARAQGLYGIYERDRLKTLLSGKINPKTGQNYTDQDIALIASGLFETPQGD